MLRIINEEMSEAYMEIISKLSDMIDEELEDAEKYAKCAMKYKTEKPVLADLFYKLSLEEMNHMSMLHQQAVSMIEEYRRTNGEPPEKMLFLYDYLHRKHQEHAIQVKAMQTVYKG